MYLNNSCTFLTPDDIKKIETSKNAKYLFQSQLFQNDRWSARSAAIFYTPVKHPNGSNYFGISPHKDGFIISDALSTINQPFEGFLNGDEVIYSRYTHDFRSFGNGCFVDGGRDYMRCGGDLDNLICVEISVQDGEIILKKIDKLEFDR